MLPINTGTNATGDEPKEEELTSPTFRGDLERLAPELLKKFDAISRKRNEERETYAQLYVKAKSDLIRSQEATTLPDENDGRDDPAIDYKKRGSGSTYNSFEGNANISPVTNTDSTNSSAAFGQIQEVVRGARRNLLDDSAPSSVARSGASNSSSVGFERPQATAKAKERLVLSDSSGSPTANSGSSNSSAGFERPQATAKATKRTALSTSSGSSTANSEPSNSSAGFERPQATAKAKQRLVLSDSSRSPTANIRPSNSSTGFQKLQAAVKSKQRFALTDSSKSDGEQGNTRPSKGPYAVSTSDALLTIKIQTRLLPVIQLLTKPDFTPYDRLKARKLAHAALHYANDCNASHPLAARCCFYIAHTYYDRADKTKLADAVAWFERATEASEADYPEGQWAQQWLNHYASVRIDADSRPSTAGSWFSSSKIISGVWGMIKGSQSSEPSSSPVSPAAPKPRPNPLWRIYSSGSSPAAAQDQDRKPFFSSSNDASLSPSSGTSSGTQDHHGLKWSRDHPYGKGEIINGKVFELVQSPEMIDSIAEEDEDEDEEKHIPANVFGGLVDAAAISPVPPLSRYKPHRHWADADFEVPDYMLEKKYHVVNASSPSESSGASSSLPAPKKQPSPTVSSDLAPASNNNSRTQSLVLSSPTSSPVADRDFAQPELDNVVPRSKKRNSISLLISATGLDIRRKRDEAAQMEEGQSPAFSPRKEEEGLYRRRSNDVVEQEEV